MSNECVSISLPTLHIWLQYVLTNVCQCTVLWHCWTGDSLQEGHLTPNKLNVGILMAVVSLELCTSKTSIHHCYLHHSCSSKVQYGSPWNRHSDVGLAGLSRLSWNIYWLLNEDDDDDDYPHYAVQVCVTRASMSKPTCGNSSPWWLMLPNLPCTTSNSLLLHRGDNLWFLWNYKFPGNSPQTMFLGILLTTLSTRTAIAFYT